mmetsp:Transcript_24523/g.31915  ORF Transcript_24523/g.31915 Transcript_24523/m.31915 type:complete len:215 (-) Transcript_24523:2056-2700(-)
MRHALSCPSHHQLLSRDQGVLKLVAFGASCLSLQVSVLVDFSFEEVSPFPPVRVSRYIALILTVCPLRCGTAMPPCVFGVLVVSPGDFRCPRLSYLPLDREKELSLTCVIPLPMFWIRFVEHQPESNPLEGKPGWCSDLSTIEATLSILSSHTVHPPLQEVECHHFGCHHLHLLKKMIMKQLICSSFYFYHFLNPCYHFQLQPHPHSYLSYNSK